MNLTISCYSEYSVKVVNSVSDRVQYRVMADKTKTIRYYSAHNVATRVSFGT